MSDSDTITVPRYITVARAAEITGTSPRTFRRWVSEGKIRGYKIAGGPSVRFRLADVLALLAPIPTVADDPALNGGAR